MTRLIGQRDGIEMSKVLVVDGKKAEALAFKEAHGGELYIGREELWIVVAGGNRKGVFWNPSEKAQQMKADTYALAQRFELPIAQYPDLTPGKLGDIFWKKIVGINPEQDKRQGKKSGYYGVGWEALAKKSRGSEEDFDHWHFESWQEHEPQWLVDRDIKSAFLTALTHAPSLYLYEHKNGTSTFIEDGGAMKKLREWVPCLPKWFKHRLVGSLASHQHRIKWGATFNTAHWAILRVFNFMKRIQEIAGEYGVRHFVDCVTLRGCTPVEVIEAIDNEAQVWGFTFSTKALGHGQLWSPTEGFIGWKNYIGTDFEVKNKIKKLGIKEDHRAFTEELVKNFGNRLSTHVLEMGNRKVYGHWNGAAFFSICQPTEGISDGKSQFFQVYPEARNREEWEKKRSQIEKLVRKI